MRKHYKERPRYIYKSDKFQKKRQQVGPPNYDINNQRKNSQNQSVNINKPHVRDRQQVMDKIAQRRKVPETVDITDDYLIKKVRKNQAYNTKNQGREVAGITKQFLPIFKVNGCTH
jgi:uncharacterized protein YacL